MLSCWVSKKHSPPRPDGLLTGLQARLKPREVHPPMAVACSIAFQAQMTGMQTVAGIPQSSRSRTQQAGSVGSPEPSSRAMLYPVEGPGCMQSTAPDRLCFELGMFVPKQPAGRPVALHTARWVDLSGAPAESTEQAVALWASRRHHVLPCPQEFGVTYLLRLNNQQKVLLNVFVVYEEARETVLPQRPATEGATTAYQWAAVTRGEPAGACSVAVSSQLQSSCAL